MPIDIQDLSFCYNEGTVFEKKALKNVNLKIEKGEFLGIIGHTGSGKSTLIQHFNALIKPTSGKILLDGFDINSDKSRLKEVRRRVGLVFQYPEYQLFEVTVFKDIAFGPGNLGISEEEIKQRVYESLSLVGLSDDIAEKSPFELSGGQKRRVAIAGVLAMRPEVLVLDEPTAGLDPAGRNEILENIKDMHERLGITIILVSHSMEDIAKYVKRLVVLNDGEIMLEGKCEEVFRQYEALEKVGLSAPQSTYLFAELRKRGINVSEDVFIMKDAVEEIRKLLANC